MSEGLVPWLIIVPLICGGAAQCGKVWKRFDRHACVLSTALLTGIAAVLLPARAAIFSGAVLRYHLGSWTEPVGITLILDGAAWVSAALIFIITFLVAVFALGERRYGAAFFFFLMIMTAGMMGVSLTGDLFTMFVCFEIVAIAAYALIAFDGTAAGLAASFKYLILSSVGIFFFLFGIFLLYRDIGSLSIAAVSAALGSPGAAAVPSTHLALVSLCAGIGVRTAFIPFHTWLPEAHAYAPHPVSALLSGVVIKISLFAMLRLLLQFGGQYLFGLLLWIGALTALSAVISALAQSDAKRLLAFSSISQMGYILAAFAAGESVSLVAAFSHAINHALFKSLLFLTVGIAVQATGERNLYRMRPLGRDYPIISAAFFIGALSICGMPPLNGYASKALIGTAMKGSPAYPLLWITSFATVASFIKLSRIYLPGAISARARTKPGVLTTVSVIALSALCLCAGIFGGPIAGMLQRLLQPAVPFAVPALFRVSALLMFTPIAVLGTAGYFLIATPAARSLAARYESFMPNVRTVLVLFFAGLACFVAAGRW